MTLGEIIANLQHQRDRYRGSGTHMENVLIEAAAALKRLRLTDAEREAVGWYAAFGKGDHAKTLRGLLERLSL